MKATANPQGLCKQSPAKSSQKVPLLPPCRRHLGAGGWAEPWRVGTTNSCRTAVQWLLLGNFLVVRRNWKGFSAREFLRMGHSQGKGPGVSLGTAIPSVRILTQEILQDEQRKCQGKCYPWLEGESSHDKMGLMIPEDLPFPLAGVLHQKWVPCS